MSDRPTHRHKKTGALVFPEGYGPSALQLLPPGFWHEQDRADALAELRAERNRRLLASGEYMWPDRPMSDETRAAWTEYRQALRDLPTTVDPLDFTWPSAPSEA